MARIPEEIIDEVRQSNDVVEVLGQYLSLKKTGSTYKALCPFHQERTPSFVVTPAKQIWHCFGCGKGGNVISFLMEHDKVSFIEALRTLAKRANITLPSSDDYKVRGLTTFYTRPTSSPPNFSRSDWPPASEPPPGNISRTAASASQSVEFFPAGIRPQRLGGSDQGGRQAGPEPAAAEGGRTYNRPR